MRVGETVKLSLQFQGCGSSLDEVWTTTDPAVAQLEPILHWQWAT